MVTIIALNINQNIWIKHTISFSIGTLIIHIIKVIHIIVFQYVQILSGIHYENFFLSIKEKNHRNWDLNSGPSYYKAPALPTEISSPVSNLNVSEDLSKAICR